MLLKFTNQTSFKNTVLQWMSAASCQGCHRSVDYYLDNQFVVVHRRKNPCQCHMQLPKSKQLSMSSANYHSSATSFLRSEVCRRVTPIRSMTIIKQASSAVDMLILAKLSIPFVAHHTHKHLTELFIHKKTNTLRVKFNHFASIFIPIEHLTTHPQVSSCEVSDHRKMPTN